MPPDLALYGKIASFAGGLMLSWDALTVQRRIKIEAGAHKLQDILNNAGLGDQLKDRRGQSLKSEERLQLWLARRSLPWTQLGFILMTLGFLLDLVSS